MLKLLHGVVIIVIPPAFRTPNSSSSFESSACPLITIPRRATGFLASDASTYFYRSPFSLSRNWRVATRTGYAARSFRVLSFVSDAVSCSRCVRRAVTKHRNSYKRERSISEKQVALQFRPPVLFMVERYKRQEAAYAD